jgi:hypothetical protein
MTTVEMMYEDIKDIKAIEQEIRLLEANMPQEMAPFPLVGKNKEHYLKSWKYNKIHPYPLLQETFDDRLIKLELI